MQAPERTSQKENPFQPFLSRAYPGPATENSSLHHLIASGASEPDVSVKMKKLKGKKQLSGLINAQETAYQVTCLHLSVIVRNRTVTELLVANHASLKEQDVNGCTPLHLAAMLEDDEILQFLLVEADKADKTIRSIQSRLFATAEEIRNSMREPHYAVDQIVGYHKTGNEPPRALTAAQFKTLTKATFCPYLLVTRIQHITNWLKPPVIGLLDPFLSVQMRLFNSQPTSLYFEEERSPDGSKSLGLGARTLRALPRYTIGDVYGGKYLTSFGSIYQMAPSEALHFCTPVSRSNDGDPTCMLLEGWMNGVLMPIALTTRPVPEGAWFHYNYGNTHICKWGHYAFTPLDDFEEFVAHVDYEQEILRYNKQRAQGALISQDALNEHLDSTQIHNRIEFIFDTPYVLSRLLIQGKMSRHVCMTVLNYFAKNRAQCNPQVNGRFKRLHELIPLLIRVLNTLDAFHDQAKSTTIKNFLLKLLDTERVIIALQEVNVLAFTITSAIEDWKDYQQQIETIVTLKEKILQLSEDLLKPEKVEQAKQAIRQLVLSQLPFFGQSFAQTHIVQACNFTVDYETALALDEIVMATVAEGNKAP